MKSQSFTYSDGRLLCEGVDVFDAAAEYGTPLYLYSLAGIREAATRVRSGLEDCDIAFKYAIKANGNIEIVRAIHALGFGADVVSGGELHLALNAGIPAKEIVFAGVGKQEWELLYALEQNVGLVSIESEYELLQWISCRSKFPGSVTKFLIRCNPGLEGSTHPYLTTGAAENKFGIANSRVVQHFAEWQQMFDGALAGLHFHLGSQILDISAFSALCDIALTTVDQVRNTGAVLELLDFGGGVGVRYESDDEPDWRSYKEIVRRLHRVSGLPLILEPGRSIVAECGIALGRVILKKPAHTKDFVVVDLAMNDLIRPALYGAHHEILAVYRGARAASERAADVVGPVCESGDFLGKNRKLPQLEPGDLVAVLTAGAYGYAMASNYNERPRPAEVLVDGSKTTLIRPRESLKLAAGSR